MKKHLANQIDNNLSDTEQFIVKINDMKIKMGLWYSLFARRIIPFLIYIIPMNVVLENSYNIINRYYPNDYLNGTFLYVSWIAAMVLFLGIAIIAPKAATVIEFVVGFAYLFFAFKYHIFTNALGYSLLIGMILFLLVKSVFLVFEIIRLKTFADDKKNHIERDESGRIVQAVGEEVFFTEQEDNPDNLPEVKSDDDVYFSNVSDDTELPISAADDDFFFAADNNDSNVMPVQSADDDYFFG